MKKYEKKYNKVRKKYVKSTEKVREKQGKSKCNSWEQIQKNQLTKSIDKSKSDFANK